MARSNMRVSLPYETEEVWNVVTSLDSYGWRSDLSKIEIVNDTTFIEYTKNGYATIFTVTAREPLKRWEFDMENENMRGHWIGLFFRNGNETTVDFTETVTVKKLFMKPLAGVY